MMLVADMPCHSGRFESPLVSIELFFGKNGCIRGACLDLVLCSFFSGSVIV